MGILSIILTLLDFYFILYFILIFTYTFRCITFRLYHFITLQHSAYRPRYHGLKHEGPIHTLYIHTGCVIPSFVFSREKICQLMFFRCNYEAGLA
ncbi:hypothetical protein FKM82_023029 [Ascaphus truei]